eukprot:PhM_4_TR4949/c0_g1_i1/m.53556
MLTFDMYFSELALHNAGQHILSIGLKPRPLLLASALLLHDLAGVPELGRQRLVVRVQLLDEVHQHRVVLVRLVHDAEVLLAREREPLDLVVVPVGRLRRRRRRLLLHRLRRRRHPVRDAYVAVPSSGGLHGRGVGVLPLRLRLVPLLLREGARGLFAELLQALNVRVDGVEVRAADDGVDGAGGGEHRRDVVVVGLGRRCVPKGRLAVVVADLDAEQLTRRVLAVAHHMLWWCRRVCSLAVALVRGRTSAQVHVATARDVVRAGHTLGVVNGAAGGCVVFRVAIVVRGVECLGRRRARARRQVRPARARRRQRVLPEHVWGLRMARWRRRHNMAVRHGRQRHDDIAFPNARCPVLLRAM